jgi:AraC-like DNA-binding protein
MLKNIGKAFSILGSTGSTIADVVDATGSSLKNGLDELTGSIKDWREESKLERAKERILARNKTIKELAEKMGISEDEARRILAEELKD